MQNNNQEPEIFVFTDEEGNDVTVQVLEYFYYNGKEYAVMTELTEEPVEELEEDAAPAAKAEESAPAEETAAPAEKAEEPTAPVEKAEPAAEAAPAQEAAEAAPAAEPVEEDPRQNDVLPKD